MNDFEMMCELIARKIFQCERYNDPFRRLANTDSWSGLLTNEFSMEYKCMVWAIISRLQNEYLDGIEGREALLIQTNEILEITLNTESNEELRTAMRHIWRIVDELNLIEKPHLSYRNTNDN